MGVDAAEHEARIAELVRVLAKVAGGDYSEKPHIVESQDALSQFALAVRFMIDDLEASRAEDAHRRAELEQANAKLRELADLKSRFVNTAAHELGTPLTPIKVQLHMLRSGKLGAMSDAQRGAIEVLARNLDRMSVLVGDLLDASRIQSDQLHLQRAPIQIDTLLHDCVQSFTPQARESGVSLLTHTVPGLVLAADGRRITQVVFNLVSNALKFTPPGGEIALDMVQGAEELVVQVHDTGAGLTHEQMDRLFRPFSQVHDTMQRTRSGTGLGLYISRAIVEQHGGRLWCESDGPGRGSTFAFSLPLVPRALAHDPKPTVQASR